MNHSTKFQAVPSTPGLKKLAAAAIGAIALMGAAPAMADTINFESLAPTVFGGTEVFSEAGYNLTVIDTPVAGPGGTGFAGVIINGLDPNSCDIAACPVGNSSHFYAGVNDGSLNLARGDNKAFTLQSLDYGFVAPVGGLASYSYGQLTVVGQKAGGGTVSASFDFPALVGGNSPFVTASLASKFGNTLFSNVTISSCIFSGNDCVNPAGNQAQFALDNVILAAVPEPETYAMMGLGLAAIGLVARRRAQKQNNV
ncbi:NF038120 family PEP-CTERM protein [Duganella sp. CY15W]|uniref:NF038120 family PEP-CTERM protein n=1 Tax=Duganella sp. CY15W TaxID=2692172 RepID=UPI001E32F7E1|nr:NF038120 family PEP-CTERM protein [Duganella sp. CY15W]